MQELHGHQEDRHSR